VTNLVEHVQGAIRDQRLFRRGEPILVAVSGGVDSMVLLRVLHQLSAAQGWRLTVGHLNHRIRGRSSDADERLVRCIAEQLGLKIVVERSNVPRLRKAEGVSLEMAARKARHQFLARTAAQLGISSIALAHHADDQVELFFLRLLRGTGSDGLAGMKSRSPSPIRKDIQLVRPLLEISKAALRQYALESVVKFREDASNACLDIQRNRIRYELLPLLRKEYQPALNTILRRTMQVVGAEAEFVGLTARKWLTQQNHHSFEDLSVAVQRRCVQQQLLSLGVTPNFELVEHLRLTCGKPIFVPLAQRVEGVEKSESGTLARGADGRIALRHDCRVSFNEASLAVDLSRKRGNALFGGLNVAWKTLSTIGPMPLNAVPGLECFDADKVGARIWLRHWHPGDRFQPSGMKSAVKLQDLFVNQKVPRKRRHELVVGISADQQLFWVEGLRISERFKLAKGTVRRLHWYWRRV